MVLKTANIFFPAQPVEANGSCSAVLELDSLGGISVGGEFASVRCTYTRILLAATEWRAESREL